MSAKQNKKSGLWISSLVFTALSLCLSFVGSILMFLDYYKIYDRDWIYGYGYYSYYSYDKLVRTVHCPETGAMPFVGFVLILVALILLIVSLKKNKLAIGSGVLSFASMPLFFASIAIFDTRSTYGYFSYSINDLTYIGYYICVVAGVLIFVAAILGIVYYTKSKKNKAVVSAESTVCDRELATKLYHR